MNDSSSKPQDKQSEDNTPFYLSGDFSTKEEWVNGFFSECIVEEDEDFFAKPTVVRTTPIERAGTHSVVPTLRTERSYVYLMNHEVLGTKIGISNNPLERIRELSVSVELTLDFVLPCKNRAEARKMERKLHSMFGKHWSRREWFDIAPGKIVDNCGFPFVPFEGVLPQ